MSQPIYETMQNKDMSMSMSPHPEHDEEREYQLCKMEMKKIRAAQAKAEAAQAMKAERRRQRRIDACDLTGAEFAIVCEELWVDFKSWVTHHENMRSCTTKTIAAIKRNLAAILLIFAFLIWFRWYIGSGREACAKFGIGGIILSFTCEVFRYVGEALVGAFIGIVAFCVGILPLIVFICVYEFDEAFPDPDENYQHQHQHHEKKD